MNQLQLFTLGNCQSCEDLKKHLHSTGIDYTTVDLSCNHWAADLMKKHNLNTVPQIFYQDQIFIRGGYRSIKTMRKHEIINRMSEIKENKNASNS